MQVRTFLLIVLVAVAAVPDGVETRDSALQDSVIRLSAQPTDVVDDRRFQLPGRNPAALAGDRPAFLGGHADEVPVFSAALPGRVSRHGAAAPAAPNQTGKKIRDLRARPAATVPAVALQEGLHLTPDFFVDDSLMLAVEHPNPASPSHLGR